MSKLPDDLIYITRTSLRTRTDWQEDEDGATCPYPGATMAEARTEFGAHMWCIPKPSFDELMAMIKASSHNIVLSLTRYCDDNDQPILEIYDDYRE